MRNLLSVEQLNANDILTLFNIASDIKASPQQYCDSLTGYHFALLFEKPSLRTRASFVTGIEQLGGKAHFYDLQNNKLGVRESLQDFSANLSHWYQGVVARVDQRKYQAFAQSLTVILWLYTERTYFNQLLIVYVQTAASNYFTEFIFYHFKQIQLIANVFFISG